MSKIVKIQRKVRKKLKLPKNPKKGFYATRDITMKNLGKRRITFKATGKKGWGKWKIISNKPISK